jgi:hypothetical protein
MNGKLKPDTNPAMELEQSLTHAMDTTHERIVRDALDHQVLDSKTLHRLADIRGRAVDAVRQGKTTPMRFGWQLGAAALVVVSIGWWASSRTQLQENSMEVAELEKLLDADVNDSAFESLDSEQAELDFIVWLADEQNQVLPSVQSIQ